MIECISRASNGSTMTVEEVTGHPHKLAFFNPLYPTYTVWLTHEDVGALIHKLDEWHRKRFEKVTQTNYVKGVLG